ncbi:MAG: transglutaminase family protein [Flavobacteriaceae bacterium]|nr:transglutaminase family protein [Flavobacteriaceae bacterium]
MQEYLEANLNFDYNDPTIQSIYNGLYQNGMTNKEFAIASYYFVRDNWPYYPYRFSLIEKDWKASNICQHKAGHCLDKGIIYISLLRKHGIPSRLGLAKVKNHIAVDDIVEKLGNDVLVPHGYVEMFLNDKWVKATPAFNKTLCEKLNVHALDFNGEEDSLFQEFDHSGKQEFMEYLEDYGTFASIPLEYMHKLMWETYPPFQKHNIQLGQVLDLSKF